MDRTNSAHTTIKSKLDSGVPEETPICRLVEMLMILQLLQQFYVDLRLNTGLAVGSVSIGQVTRFLTHYYSKP